MKIHINKEIQIILSSSISKKEKIKTATALFKSTSNKDKIGIIDAIKYIAAIAAIELK